MRRTIGTNHNLILSLHHFEGKNEENHWKWYIENGKVMS